jgi:glycosyltransferase involved in cell wall biosynthesis
MKIAFWPSRYLPFIGGLEILTHSLTTQLQKMGHEVCVLTDTGSSLHYKESTIEGIPVFAFPWDFATATHNVSLLKQNITQAQNILNEFKAEIVNIHGWYQALAFSQVRVLQNIPFCLTLHGLMVQETYQTQSCLQIWEKTKEINVVSHALHESLFTTLNLKPRPVRVIHNGRSLAHFSKSPFPQKPYHIVMVGRLSSEKNFDLAFHAMVEVRKKFPLATMCVVGGGPEWTNLHSLRSSLNLEDVIEITDFVPHDQVPFYIDQATLVWVPSSYESFSLAALETAFRKRPVIASRVHGLKEVVDDGKSGLLIEPNDKVSLVAATETLFNNPPLREQMGLHAYTRACALFSIEACAEKYLQMYRGA